MKLIVNRAVPAASGRLGPVCIACSNTRQFFIQTSAGEELLLVADMPEGEVRVTACGRCRSRNSVVIAHVD